MSTAHDLPEDCPICKTFVSGLKAVHEGTSERILWKFTDSVGTYPNLTASANSGCPCCSFLCSIIMRKLQSSRHVSDLDEEAIDVLFHFVADLGAQGPPLAPRNKLSVLLSSSNDRDLMCTLYILEDDDCQPFSAPNIKRLQQSIDNCVHDHIDCPSHQQAKGPSRLVEVMAGNTVRLQKTSPTSQYKYAALSYCWGTAGPDAKDHRTLKSNVTAREVGFCLDELPQTLQDAVLVARTMNIPYIWIDALCIVQDDMSEWESESQRMMDYYGNACLTLVPVLADSASTGMLRSAGSRPFSCRLRGPWIHERGSDLILADTCPRDLQETINISTWNQRGWTYQEMLNSSRILFVVGHRIALLCRHGNWDSLMGWKTTLGGVTTKFLPAKDTQITSQDVSVDPYVQWRKFVHPFTRRRLTETKDRWFAFSAIIENYSRIYNRQIVAGLWGEMLTQELVSWVPGSPAPLPNLDETSLTGPYRFPSWSWLSIDWDQIGNIRGINYYIIKAGTFFKSHAEAEVLPSSSVIGSADLRIVAPKLTRDEILALLEPPETNGTLYIRGRSTDKVYLDHCRCLISHPASSRCEADIRRVIPSLVPAPSALLIGVGESFAEPQLWCFLLIQPAGGNTNYYTTYSRIGIMLIRQEDMDSKYQTIRDQLISGEKECIRLV